VFTDIKSGKTMDRPGLAELLAYARAGANRPTLMVCCCWRCLAGNQRYALNQQVPLELSDGVEDIHGHRSGRTCQIDAAKREAVNCTPIPASFLTVVLTSMASRPRRLSLVTINTSPNSSRSISRAKPRRWVQPWNHHKRRGRR